MKSGAMDLTPFSAMVREKTGIFVQEDDSGRMAREIQRIMFQKGIGSPAEYLTLLDRDNDAFLSFLNLFTVNETYFFREPAHFVLLSKRLVPELLDRTSHIKILSAGCATGEEPYSIAMTLLETFGSEANAGRFAVIGADIDRDAVARAESGVYHGQSFRSMDEGLKRKYFTPLGQKRFRIREQVREMATFKVVNLLQSPLPAAVNGADIIFYRNVSIYFENATQEKIFRQLGDSLNAGGYMIVSSTETLSHNFPFISLTERDGLFLFHKEAGNTAAAPSARPAAAAETSLHRLKRARSAPKKNPTGAGMSARPKRPNTKAPAVQPSEKASGAAAASPDAETAYRRALELLNRKDYAAALPVLDECLAAAPEFIRAQTLKAGVLLNMKKTEEARALCRAAAAADPLCFEAYFFLGVMARSENDIDAATEQFKKAVYINAASWPAHFYLADAYAAGGRVDRAVRAYRQTAHLLEKGLFHAHGLGFFPLTFSEAQIIRICKRNQERLTERRAG